MDQIEDKEYNIRNFYLCHKVHKGMLPDQSLILLTVQDNVKIPRIQY